MATRTAQSSIQQLLQQGMISTLDWEQLSPILKQHVQHALAAQRAYVWREALPVQRVMLTALLPDG
jgi:hypothetical protein